MIREDQLKGLSPHHVVCQLLSLRDWSSWPGAACSTPLASLGLRDTTCSFLPVLPVLPSLTVSSSSSSYHRSSEVPLSFTCNYLLYSFPTFFLSNLSCIKSVPLKVTAQHCLWLEPPLRYVSHASLHASTHARSMCGERNPSCLSPRTAPTPTLHTMQQ